MCSFRRLSDLRQRDEPSALLLAVGPHSLLVPGPQGGRKPINAKCETVGSLPTFRDAYRRRCIVPVDGFFEWKAIKGQKAKQPYAIAMKDGSPFGIGGLWENWKDPTSSEWVRTCHESGPRAESGKWKKSM